MKKYLSCLFLKARSPIVILFAAVILATFINPYSVKAASPASSNGLLPYEEYYNWKNATPTPSPAKETPAQQQGEASPPPANTPKAALSPKAAPKSTPAPQPTITPAAATHGENDFLYLVNWNNPYHGDEKHLVRIGTVIDKNLVRIKSHHYINKTAGEAANLMFNAAKESGVTKFMVDSVYRSVASQQIMWNRKIRSNPGYGANPYQNPVKVMPEGMSEHATGLALDILATNYTSSNDGFANTPQGLWLSKNAHLFGFILRYPKDKQHITGVVFEPWHFRYVGITHSKAMHEKGMCLEEYMSFIKTGGSMLPYGAWR